MQVAAKSAMTRGKYERSKSQSGFSEDPSMNSFIGTAYFKFKGVLRSLAKRLFVRFMPLAHPVLFKLRRYFNEPITQQITHLESQVARLEQQSRAQLDRIEQYALASARRVAINCGPGEVLVRSEVGYILCSPSDHAVLACLLDSGDLERGTRLLIQSYLKPHDVFIDIGANLGLHTLAAARAMQGHGRIIAFEPFEPTQRLLARSVQINEFSQLVEIHQAAVSSHAGRQALFLGASSGHHSLFQLATSSASPAQSADVPLVRLDDVVPGSTKVDLIKIDVEGAELDVLESAKPIIAGNPSIALIVEFGFSHLARTGHSTQDWLAAFHGLGLVYRAINANTGRLEEWTDNQLESVESVNLFFARPDSVAWAKAGVAT